MAVKHLLTHGIGLSPGSVKYILTLGLVPSDNATGTGQTGAVTLSGYGQRSRSLASYSRQANTLEGHGQRTVTLESP